MIKYDNKQFYQLDDLFLYLPIKTKCSVYCRLIDAEYNECIVQFQRVRQENNYDIYQVVLDSSVSINPGMCHLYFMIIQGNSLKTAKVENIYMSFDNFSAANKLFLMDKNFQEIKNLRSQIEEYTKLNIQLYKDIREAVKIND